VRGVARDVGKALQTAFRAIEAANPERLDGIFGDAPWTNKERLPDAMLKNLLERFSGQACRWPPCPKTSWATPTSS